MYNLINNVYADRLETQTSWAVRKLLWFEPFKIQK